MNKHTLTGKTRYRTQKRWNKSSLVVLQVEERCQGVHYSNGGNQVDAEDYDIIMWRDAELEDLTITVMGN